MPFVEIGGGRIHYRVDGDPDAPLIVLSNSLGTNLAMWDRQVLTLARSFQILRYDSRGHGESLVTPGPYTIELLGRDVVRLLDSLHCERVHFCGVSLGGNVGVWLAANEPLRVDKLIVANSAAQFLPHNTWNARIEAVRQDGMSAITDRVLERWFTLSFREHSPGEVEFVRQMLLTTQPEGYMGSCAAIRDMDQRADLRLVRAGTLVIAGSQDPATPPATCREIADGIRSARYCELPAAHLSNIEAAESFNTAVAEFLSS